MNKFIAFQNKSIETCFRRHEAAASLFYAHASTEIIVVLNKMFV